MIDKNLIVHFGVSGQKFGHRLDTTNGLLERKENMYFVYKLKKDNKMYAEDLLISDPLYKYESINEMHRSLCELGYTENEVCFMRSKINHYLPIKIYYRPDGFYYDTDVMFVFIVDKEGEKMNKVEMHKGICKELTDLYERKNSDYGDSFAELRKEYPAAICLRLTDKLNRLKSLYDSKEIHKINESVEDTLKDIANYAIMELIEREYIPEKTAEDYQPIKKRVLDCHYNHATYKLDMVYWDCEGRKCVEEPSRVIPEKFCPNWSDEAFGIGKHVYDFLNLVLEEEYGEDWIATDVIMKDAMWIAQDLMDQTDISYDFEDPESIEQL